MSALETKRRQRTAAEWIAATIAVVAYIGNCAAFVVHAAAHCTSAAAYAYAYAAVAPRGAALREAADLLRARGAVAP